MSTKANVFILMGVTGCGKTTISKSLTNEINERYENKIRASCIDGDDLHSQSNKNKMSKGQPLNDYDRRPWLNSVRQKIEEHNPLIIDKNKNKIRHILFIACSALKYSYRQILRGNDRKLSANPVEFIMLHGKIQTIQERIDLRQHAFMSSNLLQSQLDTLEYPNSKYCENDVIFESIDASIEEITQSLLSRIVQTQKLNNRARL